MGVTRTKTSLSADGDIFVSAGPQEHARVTWHVQTHDTGTTVANVAIPGTIRQWTPGMARSIGEALIEAAGVAERKAEMLREVGR